MFQMPFSRKGVTYPMASSTYYKNLAVLSVLLVGSVILYAVLVVLYIILGIALVSVNV